MDNELLNKTIHHITGIYEKVSTALLMPENYDGQSVKIDNVSKYLIFVNSSLQKPYNRLAHVYAFVTDLDGLMSDRMYPFCFLSEEARNEIENLYKQGEKLVGGLNVVLSENTGILEKEPHEDTR